MTITNRLHKTHTEKHNPHWVEWVTGVVSTLLVLILLGWIGREALVADSRPPELSIVIEQVQQIQGLYRVDILLRNAGEKTAAAVHVVGNTMLSDGSSELAGVTFDYAPAQSQTKGALFFRKDPRRGNVTIIPVGYTEP